MKRIVRRDNAIQIPRKRLYLIGILFFLSFSAASQSMDTLYVYGPGGPYPAFQEAAEKFNELNPQVRVMVIKGPLKNWMSQAKSQADLFFSGSEHMMSDFVYVFQDELLPGTIYPLYFRRSGLIVRKGNPKHIVDLLDLQRPDVNIMVVNGAGLTGMWEDMVGKSGDIKAFRKVRANIVVFADNSGLAEKYWKENSSVDVWITWNIWQIPNADIADFIPVDEDYTIYRDCGIALSRKGAENPNAKLFYQFLRSEDVKEIFYKWGWE